jgi:hypothetical protein
VKLYHGIDKIAVCDSCYAEEMRQRSWYGET